MIDISLADNGVLNANNFVQYILEHTQRMRFCGANAHHQNKVSERYVRTVSHGKRYDVTCICALER